MADNPAALYYSDTVYQQHQNLSNSLRICLLIYFFIQPIDNRVSRKTFN